MPQDVSLPGGSVPNPCWRDPSGRETPRVLGGGAGGWPCSSSVELGAKGGLICFLHSAEHLPTAAQP